MKKLFAITFAVLMICSALLLTSCGATDDKGSDTKNDTETKAESQMLKNSLSDLASSGFGSKDYTGTNGSGGTGSGGMGTIPDDDNNNTGSGGKTPINVEGTLVGDVDGDGDIDDFDAYIWKRMDFKEMDGDNIRTKADVFYDGEVTQYVWETTLENYRKEYNAQ